MNGRARLLVALLAFAGVLVTEVGALRMGDPATADGTRRLLFWYAGAAACFLLGAWLVRQLPARRSLTAAIAGGALLQVVAVGYSPTSTDDFWRYLWDGKVQAAGYDPYHYAPLDPALAHLRDAEIFPPDPRTPAQAQAAQADGRTDACTTRGEPHDCTLINRPGVRTIYPPVAEFSFLWLHYLSPGEHRVVALQLAMAALAVAVSLALAWALRRNDRDPRGVVWWTWCPVVWLECGNNAHIDVLGVLLLVLALAVLTQHQLSTRRLGAAGALFGAAIAVKLVPMLIAPVLLFRRGHVVLAAAVGAFVVGYLPHLLAVGTDVLGYLPGYLEEEGYSGEQRFGAVRLLMPDAVAPTVAVLIGGAIAAWVIRRAITRTRPVAEDALLLVGAAFVLVGPSQPWYGLMLVALAVLADRPEWLAVAAATYPVYEAGNLGVDNSEMQQRAYLPAALFVVAVSVLRASTRRRSTTSRPADARRIPHRTYSPGP
ncbi:glycosyltransferase family 87 protein [Sporichthya sp.]|uniref:glycosyltransferase family 87 protein n=1 Tax=Sporichthya sp. TaxID=65475 RepID=UPI0017DDF6AC|nr:glycosyltransferase family 87 protein [Sporichthya sp.]MBA3742121.1 DUF2029 domain-containing protein [Sporichthya sp.]